MNQCAGSKEFQQFFLTLCLAFMCSMACAAIDFSDDINAEMSLWGLAYKYKEKPWSVCAEEMVADLRKRTCYQECGRNKPGITSMEMTELRRDATAYGRIFTLHAVGVDRWGRVYRESYACHVGKEKQLLSFTKVQL